MDLAVQPIIMETSLGGFMLDPRVNIMLSLLVVAVVIIIMTPYALGFKQIQSLDWGTDLSGPSRIETRHNGNLWVAKNLDTGQVVIIRKKK